MYVVKSKMTDAEGVFHDTEIEFQSDDTMSMLEYYNSLYLSRNVLQASVTLIQEWMSFKREGATTAPRG